MGRADTKDMADFTHQDYFDLERAEDQRYEYLSGEVFAMVGGTEAHALIAMNTGAALVNALHDHPCRVYGSDMKLYIAAADKFCYPDITVLCEEGLRSECYVEEPTLIVEVLSASTESYDRGLKFEHYRCIPGLRQYLLLSQSSKHAESFTREGPEGWFFREARGEAGSIGLDTWGVVLLLAEIYRNVELDGEGAPGAVPGESSTVDTLEG
jgi:Uma2 family endonuclease